MKTPPHWVREAATSVGLADDDAADLATALIRHLPLESITLAAVMNAPEARCAAIVAALSDGTSRDAPTLDDRFAELYRDTRVALEEAGVPRVVDGDATIPARVRWLAQLCSNKELLRQREVQEARRWEGVAQQARQVRMAVNHALTAAGVPTDELMPDQGVAWLARERDHIRRMFETACVDLDRERRERREAAARAEVREVEVTQRHEDLVRDRLFLVEKRREAENQLAEVRRQRDAALAEVARLLGERPSPPEGPPGEARGPTS